MLAKPDLIGVLTSLLKELPVNVIPDISSYKLNVVLPKIMLFLNSDVVGGAERSSSAPAPNSIKPLSITILLFIAESITGS